MSRPRIERSYRTLASTRVSLTLTSDPAPQFGQSDTPIVYASSKTIVLIMTQHNANALARSAAPQHFRINSVTPRHIATDLDGHIGTRTVERGARAVVEFAMLPADSPNGAFFNEEDALPG